MLESLLTFMTLVISLMEVHMLSPNLLMMHGCVIGLELAVEHLLLVTLIFTQVKIFHVINLHGLAV